MFTSTCIYLHVHICVCVLFLDAMPQLRDILVTSTKPVTLLNTSCLVSSLMPVAAQTYTLDFQQSVFHKCETESRQVFLSTKQKYAHRGVSTLLTNRIHVYSTRVKNLDYEITGSKEVRISITRGPVTKHLFKKNGYMWYM